MRTKIDIRRAIKERFGTVSVFSAHAVLHTQNFLQILINFNPSIKKLEELCEKMGCDVTDLFYPIDEAGNENNANEAQTSAESKQMDSQPQTDNMQSNAAPVIQVQPAFCPHCGKQVRVGVVLLPEE